MKRLTDLTLALALVLFLPSLNGCFSEGAAMGAGAGADTGAALGFWLGDGDPFYDMVDGAIEGAIVGGIVGGAVEMATSPPEYDAYPRSRGSVPPAPAPPPDPAMMGAANQRALQLLVECRHLEAYERLSVAHSSSAEQIRLAAFWIEAVGAVDSGDVARAERLYQLIVWLDADIGSIPQARSECEKALGSLYRSRVAQGRPERCN